MSPPSSARRPRRVGRPAQRDDAEDPVRDRLLQAATELAVERGFDAVGLREISKRAGVSAGMVSYYFGDRSGLYRALFDRATAEIGQKMEAAVRGQNAAGSDPIEALVHVQAAALAASPWLPQLIAREVLATQGSMRAHFVQQVGQGPLPLFIAAVEDAIEAGQLRADLDPKLCVLSIASLSVFPHLLLPVIGEHLGIEVDEAFQTRLIDHNLALIAQGLRAAGEKQP